MTLDRVTVEMGGQRYVFDRPVGEMTVETVNDAEVVYDRGFVPHVVSGPPRFRVSIEMDVCSEVRLEVVDDSEPKQAAAGPVGVRNERVPAGRRGRWPRLRLFGSQ